MKAKDLGNICLILSPLMYHFLNMCNAYNIINFVALPMMEGGPHVSIICLMDYHNIVVPP